MADRDQTEIFPGVNTSVSVTNTDQSNDSVGVVYELADLKQLDIETKSNVELTGLLRQIGAVVKQDGIWNDQSLVGIPLIGRQATNLTTQIGDGSNTFEQERKTLAFSFEIAYWIAQIAHELEKRELFEGVLKNKYASEPEQLLSDWTKSSAPEKVVPSEVERADSWERIKNALLKSGEALRNSLATPAEEVERVATAATSPEAAAAAAVAVRSDLDWFGDEDDASGGDGEAVPASPDDAATVAAAQARARRPVTAPEDIMRAFLAAGGGDFDAEKLGFSAVDRRLIVDQTAWIYNGVLAQVFPEAIGHLDRLDPATLAQVNQLVRDHIMGMPDRQAVLAGLVANPMARRDLINSILRAETTKLSVLSERSADRLSDAITNLNREDTIARELPDLQAYLIAQATAEGTQLTSEQAAAAAYDALSRLPDNDLKKLSSGIIPVRTAIYEAAAKSTAEATLTSLIGKINPERTLESTDAKNIALSLDSFLINEAPGRTVDELVDFIAGVPAGDLLALAGVPTTSAHYADYLKNIEEFRNSVQFYVQTRATAFAVPRELRQGDAKGSAKGRERGSIITSVGQAGSAPITPKELHDSGKDASAVAGAVMGSSASRSTAFFKHYLERWNTLTVDEQVVVYLLSDSAVPENYFSQSPPIELLGPTMGFIELESRIYTRDFQELVREFGHNRSLFRQRAYVQAFQARFRTGPTVASARTFDANRVFETQYASSWATLSQNEKIAVYLVAGATISPGQELPLIYAYADLADHVGKPAFNKLVEEVASNPAVYTSANQQAAFQEYVAQASVDTSLSNYLVNDRHDNIQTTLIIFANLSEREQEKIARVLGFASAAQFVAVHTEALNSVAATQQASDVYAASDGGTYAISSPEALSFANSVDTQTANAQLLNEIYGDGSGEARAALPEAMRAQGMPAGSGIHESLGELSRARKTGNFSRLREGMGKKMGAAKAATKKALSAVDKSVGMALKAVPYAGAALSKVWGNKYGKMLFAAPVVYFLKAISSIPGAIGAMLGGAVGTLFPVLGPATPFIGAFVGAGIGDWVNNQFFGGRTSLFSSGKPIAQSALGEYGEPGTGGTAAVTTAGATGGVLAAAAVATSAAWSVVAFPVYALGGVVLMSITVMLVIWGAFLAPSPTDPVAGIPPSGEYQESAKYIRVTKKAEPSSFENPAPGQTYSVNYTISVQPNPGYRIKITGVADEYSSFGETPVGPLTSPLTLASFGLSESASGSAEGLITEPVSAQYTQTGITGIDAYLTNKVTLTFDVYDYINQGLTGQPIETNQTYIASAFVTIGEPEIGCWPTDGSITSVPFTGIPTHAGSDAFDIGAPAGTPVYSPFVGTACAYSLATGYGKHVRLFTNTDVGQGARPLTFVFGHFSAFSDELAGQIGACAGQTNPTGGTAVGPGTIIGFVGSTGNSTGPHLHYELTSNYHGELTGGAYQSVLRLLIPGGLDVRGGQQVSSCFNQ